MRSLGQFARAEELHTMLEEIDIDGESIEHDFPKNTSETKFLLETKPVHYPIYTRGKVFRESNVFRILLGANCF